MRFATTCQNALTLLGACCAVGSLKAQVPANPVGPATTNAAVRPASTNVLTRALTLDECIRQALEHNLTIQIERMTPIRFQYSLSGSYGYYDPTFTVEARQDEVSSAERFDPATGLVPPSQSTTKSLAGTLSGYVPTGLRYDITGGFNRQSGERGDILFNTLNVGRPFDEYNASTRISLNQPLLKDFWTDSGRTAIQVAKKNLTISELRFEDQVRLLVQNVMLNYYELIFARENVRVQEKALELAQALVAQNKEKAEVGVMAPLDVKQAEAQAAGNLANVLAARRQVAFQENLLKNQITDRYESWYATSLEPVDKLTAMAQTYNLVESWTDALTKRPDFRAIRQELEKQGLYVRLNFNQMFPSLDLVGGYGLTGVDRARYEPVVTPPANVSWDRAYNSTLGGAWQQVVDVNNPRNSFGAVLSLPLTLRNERNRYKESKETERQVALQVRQYHQNILVEVDDSISQAKISFERVSATHEAALYAEAALDAEQKKLSAGKSTTFEVLRLQRDLTTARSEEIRALADFNKAMASLYSAEGTILERHRISLSFK